MEKFIIDLLIKTFKRCKGLQIGIQCAYSSNDKYLLGQWMTTLSNQSGVRRVYINDHIKDIVQLKKV